MKNAPANMAKSFRAGQIVKTPWGWKGKILDIKIREGMVQVHLRHSNGLEIWQPYNAIYAANKKD